MMKTTTITRSSLKEGMIISIVKDKLYVQEVSHNNDDSTIVRGNFTSFDEYPSASYIYYDYQTIKIVLEE